MFSTKWYTSGIIVCAQLLKRCHQILKYGATSQKNMEGTCLHSSSSLHIFCDIALLRHNPRKSGENTQTENRPMFQTLSVANVKNGFVGETSKRLIMKATDTLVLGTTSCFLKHCEYMYMLSQAVHVESGGTV